MAVVVLLMVRMKWKAVILVVQVRAVSVLPQETAAKFTTGSVTEMTIWVEDVKTELQKWDKVQHLMLIVGQNKLMSCVTGIVWHLEQRHRRRLAVLELQPQPLNIP
ncbi:TPA: hypothetical protein DD448_02250 [Candidatus Collierbacteria bacterium]|nr:hypothetical protein [Candidatus Collierbacteria bacterium]HBO10746.1 hypothetical protein [Candidatus Collierbacteria bacterium]